MSRDEYVVIMHANGKQTIRGVYPSEKAAKEAWDRLQPSIEEIEQYREEREKLHPSHPMYQHSSSTPPEYSYSSLDELRRRGDWDDVLAEAGLLHPRD
jgi:hypothetical protein